MSEYLSSTVGSTHYSDGTGFDIRIYLNELLLGIQWRLLMLPLRTQGLGISSQEQSSAGKERNASKQFLVL